MAIEWRVFNSRLGRHAFWFFMCVLLVPVTLVSALAVDHVSRRLQDQVREQLHQAAKAYGMSVMERLLLAQDELLALNPRLGGESPETRPRHTELFEQLGLIEGGHVRTLRGDIEVAEKLMDRLISLERDRHLIGIAASENASHVFMTVPIEGNDSRRVAAQLKPRFLWGEEYLPLGETGICVLEEGGTLLFCSSSLPGAVQRDLVAQSREAAVGTFDWRDPDGEYLGHYWSLFAEPRFGVNWIVVASRSREDALAPLVTFKRLFLPVIAVLVLSALLLTVVQIRRRLMPLGALIAGTRRIAGREFNQDITIDSDDEFNDLAAAFNTMSARLRTQFEILETLAEVDQLILEDLDVESVVNLIILRIRNIVDSDALLVALVDRDTPERGRLFSLPAGRQTAITERITWPGANVAALLDRGKHLQAGTNLESVPFLARLQHGGIRDFLLLPISMELRLGGVICLGYKQASTTIEHESDSLQDFADRIAVAISAAERDEQLHRQAYYDALTELPNRQLFNDRLEQSLIQAQRYDSQFALLFIDLDHFKKVNDTAGHSAGDELLRQAAARLQDSLRDADTVARLGGDEFTVIMSGMSQPKDAAQLAQTINDAFRAPFSIAGRDYYVSNSIGIALFPGDGASVQDLLKHADTAMYVAKDNGRNAYAFFEPQMNTDILTRTTLEADLRRALADNEFVLHFQPQVNARTQRVTGAEALIRWQHPKRGLVGPHLFIDVAEQSGLIEDIGEYVLQQACDQYQCWWDRGLEVGHLSVNVAPREFQSQHYVGRVREILSRFKIPSLTLGLEITERLLMSDLDVTVTKLHQLKELGLKLAIDDFGVGYSSLGYLQQFPIDILKIDRSFLIDVTQNKDSAAIVKAILSIARALELDVIAEGVEHQAQIDFLKTEGCDEIQGYFYARPMPPQEFVEYCLKRNRGSVSQPEFRRGLE